MNMVETTQTSQFFKAYYKSKPRSRRGFYVLMLSGFLIAGGIVGVYWLGSSSNRNQDDAGGDRVMQAARVATPVLPTSSVSAVLNVPAAQKNTPADKISDIDRGAIEIAVLNGSGTQGAASGTALYLRGLGYNVVKTDNADNFGYKDVSVFVKKSYSRYVLVLKKDLEDFAGNINQDNLRSSVSASISDNITYDAEVIVGE